MLRAEKTIVSAAEKANWVAAAALLAMILLTTLDVFVRLFRSSIPGTYDVVALLGAVVASFSLGYTSVEKGHIAVDFLVGKLSPAVQALIDAVNALLATALFGVAAWQSALYAASLADSGQVSLTLQIPVYPFVCGVAAGCGLLCFVLLVDFLRAVRSYRDVKNP